MAKGGKKKPTKGGKKGAPSIKRNPLFESRPRNFRIGQDIQHRRDMTRFVRWPRYILLQRQKRVLLQRLKVPPTINQFTKTVDSNQARGLFRLLSKYQPEDRKKKHERLVAEAKTKTEAKDQKKDGKDKATSKIQVIKCGLNHVTHLIENKQAKLVVIANDVDPIELVMWLPALCRKQEVPFCFVKGKARLGKLVHKKTATCVALTEVRKEDAADLDNLSKNFKSQYNDNLSLRKDWGGNKLGSKSLHRQDAQKHALEEELLKKA